MAGETIPLSTLMLKGVLRGDDVKRCAVAGAKAIIVSNHGGRHLDSAIATSKALPDVVAAVGRDVEVYVDGGIRLGTDIIKALSLGAKAIPCGRLPLWALATNGADGVTEMMNHLRNELKRSMKLCGVGTLREIPRDMTAQ